MGPCGWEVLGCDDCTALTSLDDEIREAVERRAVRRLWEWTNRRFGPCSQTVRPCLDRCDHRDGWAWGLPLGQGRYVSLNCGDTCGRFQEVVLPGPIAEVTEVLINDVEVALGAFRVDNYNRLVRTDGGKFPSCHGLEVTYLKGEAIPEGGELVAGILACEYAKGMCGDESCRLPKRVSTITRQGITMAMLDSFDKLQVGMTGIWEIDDWIATFTTNIHMGPWQMGRVSSPDIPMQRITTWESSDS